MNRHVVLCCAFPSTTIQGSFSRQILFLKLCFDYESVQFSAATVVVFVASLFVLAAHLWAACMAYSNDNDATIIMMTRIYAYQEGQHHRN